MHICIYLIVMDINNNNQLSLHGVSCVLPNLQMTTQYYSAWELKGNNIQNNLKWCIASKAHPYVLGNRKCNICLTEISTIIKADPGTLLNTRDELVSKCRYMNKFTLRRFKNN